MAADPRWWRKTREWKALVRQVYAEESLCHICLEEPDWDAPPRSSRSPSVDHLKPFSTHPHLALSRSNCRLAHYGCNSSRSARGDQGDYEPSREW